ncbi:TRP-domain-containing protein [Pleurostoma richardsiae]|uniref:TRP-domain-containing protein n=1 Tax=Pleurostoma richardsiae TaxID=41990 RepID=A0AA38RRV1_9PEZI|nr:TRP-domain-containing protein [Pleurostoma richardsiae]
MTLSTRLFSIIVLLLSISSAHVAHARDVVYVYGTGTDGVSRQLAVDRTPALYTRDFGDCLGGDSLFNITRFDAAYYSDNSTVLFHLDGTSNIRNESLMMHFSLDAYGESRYSMTFDPCYVNIYSLCPLNASVPVAGWAVFPVGKEQTGDIPAIAFSIPDFEGSVKLQIFANSSRTEIGCFQAVMTNGKSFQHTEAISPVLAVFTVVAILASFATAAYGVSIPHMRTHYAHSISVLLVFETFQSIFFSGALTVSWPSILIAWWSNFAWSAGMIYSSSIVKSVNGFTGVTGNSSQVGGAGSTVINNGGGLASQIYGRSLAQRATSELVRRAGPSYNASDPYDYTWAGVPVSPGMPLPGTWTGFPADLASIGIPAADAFIVGLIWLLVAVGIVAACTLALKLSLEVLAAIKWIQQDRLAYFRSHYIGYTSEAILRTLFVGFFAMVTLSIYQFTIRGAPGATAVAAVVFILFLVGVGGLAAWACHHRLRLGRYAVDPDRIIFHQGKLFNVIPCLVPVRSSTLKEHELPNKPAGSISWFRIHFIDNDPSRTTVHQDQTYVKKFGWLSARYRRTRWWFFSCYLLYQLIRAAFIGGGARSPLAQVYGLFVFDILAFVALVKLNPFEGQRNTALGVWMLSISKVVTTGLSIAFLPAFNLGRIPATVLGVIIIVVQGFLVIALLILIALGAISSYMSLTRNREEFHPEALEGIRLQYFEKLEARAPDVPLPPKEKVDKKGKGKGKEVDTEPEKEVLKEPYFSVTSVRRAPKIEDEDDDVVADMEAPNASVIFDPNRVVNRSSRTNSMSSRYSTHSLPRVARVHRTSWSSHDFAQWDSLQRDRPDSVMANRLSSASGIVMGHSANNSLATAPLVRPAVSQPTLRMGTPTGSRFSRPSTPKTFSRPMTPTPEVLEQHAEERIHEAPAP